MRIGYPGNLNNALHPPSDVAEFWDEWQTTPQATFPIPEPSAAKVLIQVHTCGVCRTDLPVVDGELTPPKLPLVPGHQMVGTVAKLGEEFLPWLPKFPFASRSNPFP